MNKYKLTESQLGMFLYNQFFKVPAQINPCGSILIDEVIDFNKLKNAINKYIEKQEATRIRICNTLLGPKQYIQEFKPISIRIINIKDESDIRKIENRYSNYKFKLTKELLFKVELFRLPDGKGGIVVCFNHIICDGWSMEIALRDIMKMYRDEIDDYNQGVYINHLKSEEEYFTSKRFKKDREFWRQETRKLNNPKAGIIPFDKKGEKSRTATNTYCIDKSIIEKINKYCETNKISENSFFTGIFNLYIWKVAKMDEFTIQLVTTNRKDMEEKNSFGPFFDGLYYYAVIHDMELIDYIKETNNNLFKYYKHYKYPISKVTKLLKSKGVKGLVATKIYFSYQVLRNSKQEYKHNCKINWAPMKGTYVYDMLINLHDIENTGNLYIVINYMANRYKKETIDNISIGMEKIINQVLENDKMNIGSIVI